MSADSIEQFDFKKVRRYAIDRVARYALQSVLPGRVVEPGTGKDEDEAVFEATRQLMQSWRNRVLLLRREGWDRTKSSLWLEMMNCPPVGVFTDKTRPWRCKQTQICPFCWCRAYAYETWLRLRYAYYGGCEMPEYDDDPERIPQLPKPLDLVEVLTTTKYPITHPGGFRGLLDEVAVERKAYIKTFKPLGAFQLYTLEPSDSRDKKPFWTLKHRVLAMLYPTDLDPPDISHNGHGEVTRVIKRHHGITRDVLLGAVGRACMYPAQMLRGSYTDTIAFLNYINTYKAPGSSSSKRSSGYRCSGYYGILRNKQARLLEEEMRRRLGDLY